MQLITKNRITFELYSPQKQFTMSKKHFIIAANLVIAEKNTEDARCMKHAYIMLLSSIYSNFDPNKFNSYIEKHTNANSSKH